MSKKHSRTLNANLAVISLLLCSFGLQAANVPESFWGVPQITQGQGGASYSVQDEQTYLLWIGFYYGQVDGKRSEDTNKAVKRFQSSLGEQPTGVLSAQQRTILRERAKRAQEKARFRRVRDEWTGIALDLPMGYVSDPKVDPESDSHVAYRGKGSSDLDIILHRFEGVQGTAQQILQGVKESLQERFAEKDTSGEIIEAVANGDFFKILYTLDDQFITRVLQVKNGEVRGVLISLPGKRINIYVPIIKQVISSLEAFDAAGLSKAVRTQRTQRGEFPGFLNRPDWYRSMRGSGSGSIVSYTGHVLTNFHVVEGCSKLTVNGNEALLVGVDVVNDLALVSVERFANRTPVRFRSNFAKLGEEVLVIGYPLFSVSQALNLTTGVVSARSGIGGDRRNIQITAPVQPGNSGGAVLDRDGNQIAVVVAKASTAFKLKSDAENMAWVIRGNIAQEFLEEFGVKPLLTDEPPRGEEPLSEVVDRAKRFAVRVECHG